MTAVKGKGGLVLIKSERVWRGALYIYTIQLAKMSFDEIFDLTAGVYFNFYNIIVLFWTTG